MPLPWASMSWNLPEDRGGYGHRLLDLDDVVDAENRRAVGGRQHRGGDRATQALAGVGAVDPADEALARGADDQRPAQLGQLRQAPQQLEIVLGGLAEADARVEPDPLLADAGGERRLDPRREERLDLGHDVVVAGFVLHRPR